MYINVCCRAANISNCDNCTAEINTTKGDIQAYTCITTETLKDLYESQLSFDYSGDNLLFPEEQHVHYKQPNDY